MSSRILVVDDDLRLHELLSSYLAQNGFVVERALDGASALQKLDGGQFDCVLLDVMMPGMDGLEVCRRIRKKSDVPVVMLTARGDETDRIVGLEIGADDYLPKPFNPRELLARLKAILRRVRPEADAERLAVGPIQIEIASRRVTAGDKLIDLTGIEFDILVALARRAGQVIPRDRLLSAAGRGDVVVSERTIDVHISHLRQKLGEPAMIKTVRGVGYVLARDNGDGDQRTSAVPPSSGPVSSDKEKAS
ncbi:MAG: response regulator transcription factor [Myxococcales bacterium]|nr:response regulator transcription factor [Myxococcales bacterium]